MRKRLLCVVFILTLLMLGCDAKVENVSVDDLINGEVEDGAEIEVIGKAAFLSDANKEIIDIPLEGPTQIIKIVDKNSKGFDLYNEIEVTGEKIKKDEEITVKGIYHDVEDSISPVILAKEIDK